MNLRDLLLDLSDNVFAPTWRRLAGLTDTELLWEPAPNCWSVRERADGTVHVDWAPYIRGGELTDPGFVRTTSTGGDAFQPPPFTNLAWRIWHLTEVYGRSQNERVLTGRAGEEEIAVHRVARGPQQWPTCRPHTTVGEHSSRQRPTSASTNPSPQHAMPRPRTSAT